MKEVYFNTLDSFKYLNIENTNYKEMEKSITFYGLYN